MRILVNGTTLSIGGGIQVGRSLLVELNKRLANHEIKAVVSPQLGKLLPSDVKAEVLFPSPARLWSGRSTRRRLYEIEREFAPDVVLTIFGPAYWKPKALHICGYANPLTFAANSWAWKMVPWKRKPKAYVLSLIRRKAWHYENADALVVETESVRSALSKIWPAKKIAVISNNCGQSFFERIGKETQERGSLALLPEKEPGEFRIVTLSGYYPHKNLEMIPIVAKLLKDRRPDDRFRFCLSLDERSPEWKRIRRLAETMSVGSYLFTSGLVNPQFAPEFYREADAMFLPSVLECFSANYPEAMCMEVPIVTTDLPFAHDVCQDAALYFPPRDEKSAADKLLQLRADRNLREDLIRKGLNRAKQFPTPAEKAKLYIEACDSLYCESRERMKENRTIEGE